MWSAVREGAAQFWNGLKEELQTLDVILDDMMCEGQFSRSFVVNKQHFECELFQRHLQNVGNARDNSQQKQLILEKDKQLRKLYNDCMSTGVSEDVFWAKWRYFQMLVLLLGDRHKRSSNERQIDESEAVICSSDWE